MERLISSRGSILDQPSSRYQEVEVPIETEHVLKQKYYNADKLRIPSQKLNTTPHKPIHVADLIGILNNELKRSNSGTTIDTLDGFYILEASEIQLPDHVVTVSIAGKQLKSVVEDDLMFFTNLQYMDASENLLNVFLFEQLPALQDLRLACNHIKNIDSFDTGFDNLWYLDLSYNSLTIQSIQNLSTIQNLKELDLCGNELKFLPSEMFRFQNLDKLILEHNKFEDIRIFFLLSLIPNLRFLSLAYNYLSAIPADCCKEGFFR